MKLINTTLTALLTGCFLTASALAADEEAQTEDAKVQTEGAEVGQWTMDYDAALKLAKEKELPVMLNFTGSDWCGWCKLMDKSVFSQDEWKKYAAENVVLVTLDFPKDDSIVPAKYVDRNRELQEKFEVQGYPTYVVLDGDGKTVLGKLGAGRDKTPSSFIQEFKGITQLSESSIAAYIKANPEKAEAYKAAIAEYKGAKQALTDWIATQPERNEENNQKFTAFQERIQKAEAALAEFN